MLSLKLKRRKKYQLYSVKKVFFSSQNIIILIFLVINDIVQSYLQEYQL